MHTPVLLQEAIEALCISPQKKYIDATHGEGGHSREIASRGGEVLAIEWDEERYKVHKAGYAHTNIQLVLDNFANIERIARQNGFYPADGILFDLGLSMEQIGKSGRGFSYRMPDEPLDMRISKKTMQNAADIVNNSSVEYLYELFSRYSQEINSRSISEAIFRAARLKKMQTVRDILEALPNNEQTIRRVFQALRMEVNDELSNIKNGMAGAAQILAADGRMVIISFHQTEDRIVKLAARHLGLKPVAKKPISGSTEKKFERSAKLRVYTL